MPAGYPQEAAAAAAGDTRLAVVRRGRLPGLPMIALLLLLSPGG